jgi:hypothetical protein
VQKGKEEGKHAAACLDAQKLYFMLSSRVIYLFDWKADECLNNFIAELEVLIGFSFVMLSDHLPHIRSRLEENAVKSHEGINVSDIA